MIPSRGGFGCVCRSSGSRAVGALPPRPTPIADLTRVGPGAFFSRPAAEARNHARSLVRSGSPANGWGPYPWCRSTKAARDPVVGEPPDTLRVGDFTVGDGSVSGRTIDCRSTGDPQVGSRLRRSVANSARDGTGGGEPASLGDDDRVRRIGFADRGDSASSVGVSEPLIDGREENHTKQDRAGNATPEVGDE